MKSILTRACLLSTLILSAEPGMALKEEVREWTGSYRPVSQSSDDAAGVRVYKTEKERILGNWADLGQWATGRATSAVHKTSSTLSWLWNGGTYWSEQIIRAAPGVLYEGGAGCLHWTGDVSWMAFNLFRQTGRRIGVGTYETLADPLRLGPGFLKAFSKAFVGCPHPESGMTPNDVGVFAYWATQLVLIGGDMLGGIFILVGETDDADDPNTALSPPTMRIVGYSALTTAVSLHTLLLTTHAGQAFLRAGYTTGKKVERILADTQMGEEESEGYQDGD